MKRFFSSFFGVIFLFFAVSPSVFAASDAWQIGDGFMVFKENTDKTAVNVGIGIGLPTEKLDVDGNGKFSGKMAVGGYNVDANYAFTSPSIYGTKGEFGTLCIGSGTGTDCKTSWNQIVSAGGGILTETDPIWTVAKGNYYLKTETDAKYPLKTDVYTKTEMDVSLGLFKAFAKVDLPNCTAGQVLKSDGTQFLCIADVDTKLSEAEILALGFIKTETDSVFVASNLNKKITVLDSGNVGIGTTNPTAKLEVSGQIKINGGTPGNGKVLTSDENGLATWTELSAGSEKNECLGGDGGTFCGCGNEKCCRSILVDANGNINSSGNINEGKRCNGSPNLASCQQGICNGSWDGERACTRPPYGQATLSRATGTEEHLADNTWGRCTNLVCDAFSVHNASVNECLENEISCVPAGGHGNGVRDQLQNGTYENCRDLICDIRYIAGTSTSVPICKPPLYGVFNDAGTVGVVSLSGIAYSTEFGEVSFKGESPSHEVRIPIEMGGNMTGSAFNTDVGYFEMSGVDLNGISYQVVYNASTREFSGEGYFPEIEQRVKFRGNAEGVDYGVSYDVINRMLTGRAYAEDWGWIEFTPQYNLNT